MSAVDTWVAPLDAVRRDLLALGGRPVRRLLLDRRLRVALAGLSVVGTSLACTAFAPLWTLALGPIVLGVPHLVSDVRYLLVRPGLSRRREVRWAMGLPLLAVAFWPHAWVGILAALGAVAVARAQPLRRGIALLVGSVIYLAARTWTPVADLAVVHLHNLVAVALWWWWRPRTGGLPWLVPLAFAAGLLWTASPGFSAWVAQHGTLSFPRTGSDLRYWARYSSAGLPPEWGLRAMASFCFAQSVHYGIWLRLVPDDDRARVTPRSFRATLQALQADLGTPFLLAVTAGAVGLALWGAVDLAQAREGYLRASAFHAYLELAVAALLWTERRNPRTVAAVSG